MWLFSLNLLKKYFFLNLTSFFFFSPTGGFLGGKKSPFINFWDFFCLKKHWGFFFKKHKTPDQNLYSNPPLLLSINWNQRNPGLPKVWFRKSPPLGGKIEWGFKQWKKTSNFQILGNLKKKESKKNLGKKDKANFSSKNFGKLNPIIFFFFN